MFLYITFEHVLVLFKLCKMQNFLFSSCKICFLVCWECVGMRSGIHFAIPIIRKYKKPQILQQNLDLCLANRPSFFISLILWQTTVSSQLPRQRSLCCSQTCNCKNAVIGPKGRWKLGCILFRDWSIINIRGEPYLLDEYIFASPFEATSHCLC